MVPEDRGAVLEIGLADIYEAARAAKEAAESVDRKVDRLTITVDAMKDHETRLRQLEQTVTRLMWAIPSSGVFGVILGACLTLLGTLLLA
jgi:hypothetical protein